ncbi:MAG: AbrB/MazE/SpoVT family DNA-binding domain-containing protein [Candidatus Hydrothermarchaeales archaeon]
MSEVEIIGEVDTKGRVTIPKKLRDRLGLGPKDRVKLKIVESLPKKSFVKECRKTLKGTGDAVKLLHEESPFR